MVHQLDTGIVGVGFMGEIHARLLTEHPQTNLKSVIDLDEDRANEVADQFGIPTVETDLETAIDHHDLDAIVVATPEEHHREPTETALDRDVHVLLEKPISASEVDARKIGEAAQASEAELMVAYVCRFHPEYAALKSKVSDGDIGEVVGVSAGRVANREIYEMAAEWSHPMYYLAVHDIDAMLWLVDANVESVSAAGSPGLDGLETPAVVSATITFDNGAVGTLETNWGRANSYPSIRTDSIAVTGRDGYAKVVMEPDNAKLAASDRFEHIESSDLHGRWTDMYRFQLDHFVEAVTTDIDPLVTWEDGLASLKVANAIVESIDADESVVVE